MGNTSDLLDYLNEEIIEVGILKTLLRFLEESLPHLVASLRVGPADAVFDFGVVSADRLQAVLFNLLLVTEIALVLILVDLL